METYLIALALQRAGYRDVETVQQAMRLPVTGQVDRATLQALEPYLLGYRRLRLKRGDTFWSLAQRFGVPVETVQAANPDLDPLRLPVGAQVTVPLPFPVVPVDIPMTSALCQLCIRGLVARYPFVQRETLTTTAYGRPVERVQLGRGRETLLYTAAHHANEWITATLLLAFIENLAKAAVLGQTIAGENGADLLRTYTFHLVPMVNPDGVDLVTGALQPGDSQYESARQLGERYPDIPFPSGWKANLLGVDLNLNYPAQWERAREIKFSQGYTQPGPRDYVGSAPLTQQETKALADLTRQLNPSLVLAYHTQGEVIYWQFENIDIPGARALAERFSRVSGYSLEDTPYASSFAGYKDWFIQDFRKPGFTIEAGKGENPLPLGQFPRIFQDNLGVLAMASG